MVHHNIPRVMLIRPRIDAIMISHGSEHVRGFGDGLSQFAFYFQKSVIVRPHLMLCIEYLFKMVI